MYARSRIKTCQQRQRHTPEPGILKRLPHPRSSGTERAVPSARTLLPRSPLLLRLLGSAQSQDQDEARCSIAHFPLPLGEVRWVRRTNDHCTHRSCSQPTATRCPSPCKGEGQGERVPNHPRTARKGRAPQSLATPVLYCHFQAGISKPMTLVEPDGRVPTARPSVQCALFFTPSRAAPSCRPATS